jgi:hypothetical protein
MNKILDEIGRGQPRPFFVVGLRASSLGGFRHFTKKSNLTSTTTTEYLRPNMRPSF